VCWDQRALLPVHLSVWFAAAVLGTLANKELMRVFPLPVFLTLLHLLSGALLDAVLLRRSGVRVRRSLEHSLAKASTPVAVTLALAKMLTYLSYGAIPVSLTHTVKSASPLFSACLNALFFPRQKLHGALAAALIPISLGVTLSAVTEINFRLGGFLAAVVAAFAGVLQSVFSKQCIERFRQVDPIVLHLHNSAIAFVLLLPLGLFFETRALLTRVSDSGIPLKLLFVSVLAQYFQTIMSKLSHIKYPTHSNASLSLFLLFCTFKIKFLSLMYLECCWHCSASFVMELLLCGFQTRRKEDQFFLFTLKQILQARTRKIPFPSLPLGKTKTFGKSFALLEFSFCCST